MHRTISRPLTLAVAVLLAPQSVERAAAQRLAVAGGINAASVPRALAPLCASARRLGGPGLSGRVEIAAGRVRVGATIDHVARIGVHDVAECAPRSGISVDSSFSRAGRSATALAVNAWIPVNGVWRVGAEVGSVMNHSSWFAGPAFGAQHRRIHVEIAARRHATQFDEITRDYGSSGVHEISRVSSLDGSWGAVARLLIRP